MSDQEFYRALRDTTQVPWRWRFYIWWREKILRQPLPKGEFGKIEGVRFYGGANNPGMTYLPEGYYRRMKDEQKN